MCCRLKEKDANWNSTKCTYFNVQQQFLKPCKFLKNSIVDDIPEFRVLKYNKIVFILSAVITSCKAPFDRDEQRL